ncbi:MAG: DUF5678 domain-containing protein [Nanoarchaeota archaeon]
MEQDIMLELKGLGVDSSFISRNAKEFSRKYAKKFIAVHNNELITFGENFEEVLKKVVEMGLNPASVLIEYIPGSEEIILY